MYLRQVEIQNIRAIENFKMTFPEGREAGWHVLIGDNGAGKSTIVRSIAAVLIGPEEIGQIRPYWEEWLAHKTSEGKIHLQIFFAALYDKTGPTRPPANRLIVNEFLLKRNGKVVLETNFHAPKLGPRNFNWADNDGWFSVAYGPFRRFTGGNSERSKVFFSAPKAGAHLSVFGEDIALTEALEWLKELDRRRLKERESYESFSNAGSVFASDAELVYRGIKHFLNESGLLPHEAKFLGLSLEGDPIFKDGNGNQIKVTQLSDGYRSILSLTFELIRQLVRVYGVELVFKDIDLNSREVAFTLPGVVLIDEIDAHLHPTWQTRIGQWFTRYFPNLQFIVTTHSPLVCRASENGSIWRLAAPGSGRESGEIIGEEKAKLVFGDVLDAYETEAFGNSISRGQEGLEKQAVYRDLVYKENYGVKMTNQEKTELQHLKSIFHTNVASEA